MDYRSKYDFLMDYSQRMMWVLNDPQTIVECNQAFSEFLGKTKQEVVNAPIKNLFRKEDVKVHLQENKSVFEKKKESFIHQRMNTQASSNIVMLIKRTPILDERGNVEYVLCEGISGHVQETQFRTTTPQDEVLRSFVEGLHDVVSYTNIEGYFSYVSPQWQELLGYTSEEMLGKRRTDFMDQEDANHLLEQFDSYYAKQISFRNLVHTLTTKDGRKIVVEASGTPQFDNQGNFSGYQVISRDITSLKQWEREIALSQSSLERTIIEKNNELKSKNSSLQVLLTYQEALAKISTLFINTSYEELDNQIDQSLQIVGQISEVDRSYIFLFDEDNSTMSNLYEWCNQGIEPEKHILQNIPTDIFPWWMKKLHQDEVINIYDVNLMSSEQQAEKDILQVQSVLSVLVVPLNIENKLIGFLGFDSVVSHKRWDEQIELLRLLAELYALTIQRKEQDRKLKETLEITKRTFSQTIEAFASIVEISDPYTSGHQSQVGALAKAIALKMGLGEQKAEAIYLAGLLHDLGKFYIPSQILNKPGKLTDIEFSFIKTHPTLGYQILSRIEFPWPIADMVLQHHERIDGSGYPYGLQGDEIMIEAKILCVADVVDSISAHRPYRPALGLDFALKEIKMNSGVLYDPEVVNACVQLIEKDKYVI